MVICHSSNRELITSIAENHGSSSSWTTVSQIRPSLWNSEQWEMVFELMQPALRVVVWSVAVECDQLPGYSLAACPWLLSSHSPHQGRFNTKQHYRALGTSPPRNPFLAGPGPIPRVTRSCVVTGPTLKNHIFWTKNWRTEYFQSVLLGNLEPLVILHIWSLRDRW